MKIAVIGTGISGNVAAYKLSQKHDVTVFEKNDYIGGHTHTHSIDIEGESLSVDTGFIVFNDRTYPHFTNLLGELGVAVQKTEMSFSMKSQVNGLEYKGSNLDSMFAQRRNLFNPRFYRFVLEILRFNKRAKECLDTGNDLTLNEFLQREKFSEYFIQNYLIPMGAAIWSTDPALMRRFPAQFFLRFFENHGLLDIKNRPQWYVIKGGSSSYIKPLIEGFKDRVRLNSPVSSVRRTGDDVYVCVEGQAEERFDAVFMASHSNETLAMLSDATTAELEVLGAIKYQPNEAILHTDQTVLPHNEKAWAAWNYHLLSEIPETDESQEVALTYNMNILQGLSSTKNICVTLNNTAAIDDSKIIKRLNYEHPIFTPESVTAQSRQSEINGERGCYFCGAYWSNGFHEDGVASALKAVSDFEAGLAK